MHYKLSVYWVFVHALAAVCRLFFKINCFKISFRDTTRVSNCLDPDWDLHFVDPGLGTNCLQRLSEDKCRRYQRKS